MVVFDGVMTSNVPDRASTSWATNTASNAGHKGGLILVVAPHEPANLLDNAVENQHEGSQKSLARVDAC